MTTLANCGLASSVRCTQGREAPAVLIDDGDVVDDGQSLFAGDRVEFRGKPVVKDEDSLVDR
jgi:hypothetical protein